MVLIFYAYVQQQQQWEQQQQVVASSKLLTMATEGDGTNIRGPPRGMCVYVCVCVLSTCVCECVIQLHKQRNI